jgi:hypothetical protein
MGISFLINDILAKRGTKLVLTSFIMLILPFIPYLIWAYSNNDKINSDEFNWVSGLHSLAYNFIKTDQNKEFYFSLQAGWFYFLKDLVFTSGFMVLIIFWKNFKNVPSRLWRSLLITSPLFIIHLFNQDLFRYTHPFLIILILIFSLMADKKYIWLLIPTATLTFLFQYFSTNMSLSNFQVVHPEYLIAFCVLIILWIFLEPVLRFYKITFLIIGLMTLALQNHMFPTHTFSYPPVTNGQLIEILNPIIEKTGWDYNTFRTKTFFDRLLSEEVDTQIVYNFQFDKMFAKRNENIDLVIISDRADNFSIDFPKEIQLSLLNGDLVLKDQFFGDEFKIQFFQHTKLNSELYWNNVGHNYIDALADIRKLADNWQFISECEAEDPKCRVYFGFKIDYNQNILKFYSYGFPVGVTSQANNASWVTYIERMKLNISCSNFSQEFEPVQFLGHRSPGNSRFLAPFSNYIKLPCQDPQSISLKINKGGGYRIDYKPQVLKEQILNWDLSTPD